ncbi:MAG: tRNA lysidine(34) synthetase TilS [Burkholderiales bacterium]
MSDFLAEIVAQALKTSVLPGRKVAVGLSGGMDSVVLLDVLCCLREALDLQLQVVHINHQIHSKSGQWEEFCRALCAQRQVPIETHKVNIDPRDEGLEAAARRVRYAIFDAVASDAVALAHHADDQVETIFLQLLRGAGPKGLAAMPSARKPANRSRDSQTHAPILVRPLLSVPRAQIHAYAVERKLAWVEDNSNRNMRYDRNFLRQEVLPLLDSRFPAYRETMARSARNFADAMQLAEDIAHLDAVKLDNGTIPVALLRELQDARALNLLRHLFELRRLRMPPRSRLVEALRQCRHSAPDAGVHVSFGAFGLHSYQGRVTLVATSEQLPSDWQATWNGVHALDLPGGLGCLKGCQRVGEGIASKYFEFQPATVRGRVGGERLQSSLDRPRRSLKNMLRENAVPPWERKRMPLIFFGERLAWVPGIGVAQEFRAAEHEPGIVPAWSARSVEQDDPGETSEE